MNILAHTYPDPELRGTRVTNDDKTKKIIIIKFDSRISKGKVSALSKPLTKPTRKEKKNKNIPKIAFEKEAKLFTSFSLAQRNMNRIIDKITYLFRHHTDGFPKKKF